MKAISSRDNPLFKELKLLATSSQARRRAGRTLLDGVHLCQTYMQQVGMPPLCVLNEAALKHAEVAEIARRCEETGAHCVVLPDALYNVLSQVETGVGILFVIDTPATPASLVVEHAAVLLDNLQDPGNLGSILRSAAAAGIRQVFCSKGTVFAWSPKVLRAGMGAHFQLQIMENVDLLDAIQRSRIPVLATSSHAKRPLYEADLRQPVAWLFGHEGNGVSDELLSAASLQVGIPHLGNVESLNVAASAAVCFFEQVRQRLAARH